jgi:ABC-2 type transport system permease protein
MLHVFVKEFNAFLNSLIAYVVIGVFLCAIGLLMWVFPETSVLEYGYADMDTLFSLGPYVLIFLIPAITMRSFAEEQKSGTLELLFTRPLTHTDIIAGKFLACFVLVLFSLLPTLVYYISVYSLGNPEGNIDTPGVIGSYIGLCLLGAAFCAIGIMASSTTGNQIVAFILSAFCCFLFFSGFNSLASIDLWSDSSNAIKQLGILYHYESLSKGLIDSGDVLYFLSIIALALLITRTVMASRSW